MSDSPPHDNDTLTAEAVTAVSRTSEPPRTCCQTDAVLLSRIFESEQNIETCNATLARDEEELASALSRPRSKSRGSTAEGRLHSASTTLLRHKVETARQAAVEASMSKKNALAAIQSHADCHGPHGRQPTVCGISLGQS